jgi:pilus assembly protein TadC
VAPLAPGGSVVGDTEDVQMTFLVAAMVFGGVFLVVVGGTRTPLAERLGRYLMPETVEAPEGVRRRVEAPWLVPVVCGGLVGALLAQGDLFLAGSGRSVPALTCLGAGAAYFIWSFRRTNAKERLSRRLRFELPVVADAIALHVVAGASVSSALRTVHDQMTGVAVDEIADVVRREDEGEGLAESLLTASRATLHPDGRRLYDLLAHAHESGGRLATMLSELALDLRAGIERDLSSEGGKRAVASYGPILGLMVPVALLFLLYPTLLGLRALSGTP